jgi:hypothetical protein
VGQQSGLTEGQAVTMGWLVIAVGIGTLFLAHAYVLYRVGRKFGIGSFGAYCVPVYNLILICRCARLPGWVAIGVLGVALSALIPSLAVLFYAIAAGFNTYLWGSVSQRLGKSFWPWGIASGILYVPVLWLAFDSSIPVGASTERKPGDAEVYDVVYLDEADGEERLTPNSNRPVIRCTAGEYIGETLELPRGGIVIGRDPASSQLVLDSAGVSASHVQIAIDPADEDTVVVTDLGSTNGTYVLEEVTGGSYWDAVHGSYRYPHRQPRRIRIGDGIAEFEIGSRLRPNEAV